MNTPTTPEADAGERIAGETEGLLDDFKHWDFCPLCNGALDTGLECENCRADWMRLKNALEAEHAAHIKALTRAAVLEGLLKDAMSYLLDADYCKNFYEHYSNDKTCTCGLDTLRAEVAAALKEGEHG